MVFVKKRSSFYLVVMCGQLSAFMNLHAVLEFVGEDVVNGGKKAVVKAIEDQTFQDACVQALSKVLDGSIKNAVLSYEETQSGKPDFVQGVVASLKVEFGEKGEGRKVLQEVTKDLVKTFYDSVKSLKYQLVSTAVGVTAFYYGSKVAWLYIEKQMSKPKVMNEYCHNGWLSKMMSFIKTPAPVVDISYPQETQDRLDRLIKELKLIIKKKNGGRKNVSYRKILLTGGSSLDQLRYAKQCAQKSGIDFAIITGASLFQKGAGVAAIDELCALAQKSKTGLCLIVDRADPLLLDPLQLDPSSETYQIISHFHNCLRDNGDKLMLVATSNGKDLLQKAKLIEIDEVIEIAL